MKKILLIGLICLIFLCSIVTVNAVNFTCNYDDETYNLDDVKANNGELVLWTDEVVKIPNDVINDVEKANKDTNSKKYVKEFKTKYTKKVPDKTKKKLVKKGKYILKMSKRDFKSFKKYVLKKHRGYQSTPRCLNKYITKIKVKEDDYTYYNDLFKNVKFKVKILKKMKVKELYQKYYADSRDYRWADGYKFKLIVKKYKNVKTYKNVPIRGRFTVNTVNSGGVVKHENYLDFVYSWKGRLFSLYGLDYT